MSIVAKLRAGREIFVKLFILNSSSLIKYVYTQKSTGFLLMPFVQMIRNPLNGIPLHHHGLNAMNLGRILPARASHRSVDYEELAKRLDMMDKILSRALRQTHREA